MNRGRLVTGLLLVSVGLLLALDAANVWDGAEVLAQWWPLAFFAFAVSALLDRPPNYSAAAILSVIGVILLNGTLDLVPDIWELLWPLLLVGAGLWVLLSAGRRPSRRAMWTPTSPTPVRTAEESVQVTALFSGRDVLTAADPLRSGVAVALFGAVELDLRSARLPREGAVLDATAVFGGVTIIVPPGWNVTMSGPAIFGGTENHADALGPPPPDAPKLTIRALAIFGGVEVKAGAVMTSPELVDA